MAPSTHGALSSVLGVKVVWKDFVSNKYYWHFFPSLSHLPHTHLSFHPFLTFLSFFLCNNISYLCRHTPKSRRELRLKALLKMKIKCYALTNQMTNCLWLSLIPFDRGTWLFMPIKCVTLLLLSHKSVWSQSPLLYVSRWCVLHFPLGLCWINTEISEWSIFLFFS